MNLFLRCFFSFVIVSMLALATWASWQCPLFAIPRDVFMHPWFLTTLVDAYWAFLSVFVWVAWKERSAWARVLWLVSLVLLGNLAIGAYFLRELFAIPLGAPVDAVFTRRNAGTLPLPATLAALAVGVYLIA